MEETSKTPAPISGADSADLFRRWRTDQDRDARNQLIERHLPLARKLARRYASSADSHEDLTQVASLGLVKAVERFDPDRGFAFTSFAVPTIVGELKRYFRDAGWALHVDRSAQERARRVMEAQKRVSAKHGRPPTVVEIAQYLECSEEDVLEGLQTAEAHAALSLDAPRGRWRGRDDATRVARGARPAPGPRRRRGDGVLGRPPPAPSRAGDPLPPLQRAPHAERDRQRVSASRRCRCHACCAVRSPGSTS